MKAKVIITNELGLHARPLSKWLQVVNKYDVEVEVLKEGKEYNGKSMISLMKMGAQKGDELAIQIKGKDENNALKELIDLVKNGFGE